MVTKICQSVIRNPKRLHPPLFFWKNFGSEANLILRAPLIENKLSQVVDPILYKMLNSWISQFSHHKIFIRPGSSDVSRRSIQPYFHSQLPKNSTTLAQPYMSYLNPAVDSTPSLDPSLSLIGFHPSDTYHKSETTHTNQLIRELYTKVCYKYETIKTSLKKT